MKYYADAVINIARNEVGYLEKASNKNLDDKTANAGKNNYTKYARDLDAIPGFYNYKKNGYEWCDIFVDWCLVKAFGADKAKELLRQPDKSLGAGCKYSMNYYKANGQLYSKPAVGDQIFFKNSDGDITHTGLVYDVDKTYVYTIEGNTSSASGVVANGGAVAKKKYKLSYAKIAGYGRPDYDLPELHYIPTTKEWQKAAQRDGFEFPKYGADGKWGSECEGVAKKAVVKKQLIGYKYPNLTKLVQKVVGVAVDGKCGSKTEAAIEVLQKYRGLTVDRCAGPETYKCILGVK